MKSKQLFFIIISASAFTIFVFVFFKDEISNRKSYNVAIIKDNNYEAVYQDNLEKSVESQPIKTKLLTPNEVGKITEVPTSQATTSMPSTVMPAVIPTVSVTKTELKTISSTIFNPPTTLDALPTKTTVLATRKPTIFDCHVNSQNLPTMPNILKLQPKADKSLFYLETSCRSKQMEKIVLNVRQACSIESAALTNPNFDVFLLVANPAVVKNTSDLNDRILNALLTYQNLKISHIDIEEYFLNTPVEQLYKSHLMENSTSPVQHLSDVLRFVTMWRYGGTYLDLDVLVLDSFADLPPNFTAFEYDYSIGAGIMNFQSSGKGHQWVQQILEDINKDFRPREWSYNANGAISRFAQQLCHTKNGGKMTPENCQGFTIYERKLFYPLWPTEWETFFNKTQLGKAIAMLTNSKAVHMWNTYTAKGRIVKGENTAYEVLAMEYCPKVYQQLDANTVF